jgi:hypothetical protein
VPRSPFDDAGSPFDDAGMTASWNAEKEAAA